MAGFGSGHDAPRMGAGTGPGSNHFGNSSPGNGLPAGDASSHASKAARSPFAQAGCVDI